MTKEKIERINFLARKKKSEGLSDEEAAEQQALYAEYLCEIRASFGQTLEHTSIRRPDGSVEKLKKKKK